MARLPMTPGTCSTMALVCEVVLRRGNKEVLLDYIFGEEMRPVYRARVSCDGGKTWGWHRITKRELVEVNAR
jgi:hypothetical protein